MQISIEQLKPLGSKIISELNRDKEPLEMVKAAIELLDKVILGEATLPDPWVSRYFFEDFLGGISKAALKSYHFKDRDMIEAVIELGIKMAKLFAQEVLRDNEEYTFAMRYVLDPDMAFYRQFGITHITHESVLFPAPETPEWRKNFKVGDALDVLKVENTPITFSGWSTGKIVGLTSSNTVKISLDGVPSEDNLELPTTSPNLAPYGSHTGGTAWREKLKEGSLIDCMDTAASWYKSTVLETKAEDVAGKKVLMVNVGYRRYDPTGVKKDEKGNPYIGWSNTYDEWLNAFSIRIQRPDTVAKIGKIACKKAVDEEDKEKYYVDDASDILVNSVEGEEIYAILRADKVKSAAVVTMLNTFGKEGGFDNMLQRMTDKDRPITYSMIWSLTG